LFSFFFFRTITFCIKEVKKNMDIFYVVGHKNPDTDSVCSAIALSDYLSKCSTKTNSDEKYEPAIQGEINEETKCALNKFGVETPLILTDATNKKVILVDHNNKMQTLDNIEKAEKIVRVLDHHPINFSYQEQIEFLTMPVGSTATIIAQMYFKENINIDKKIAGLLLSAILSDTVVFKSPTTTDIDKIMAKKLEKIADISNFEVFGLELKKAKASLKNKTPCQIIDADFKEFNMNGCKVGIGQLEVVDFEDFYAIKEQVSSQMKKMKQDKNYTLVLLVFTDILREGSEFLTAGDVDAVKKAFNISTIDGIFLKGMMSRKKQVAPLLENYYNKNQNNKN